jgi:hypothetical protein
VGVFKNTVVPAAVGDVRCSAFNESTFGAEGKINEIAILRIKDVPFAGTATISGANSAKVNITKPMVRDASVATLPMRDSITYLYDDGKVRAKVEQTFANQTLFSGSYTEFWVEHNVPGYPNVNIRFWWERT